MNRWFVVPALAGPCRLGRGPWPCWLPMNLLIADCGLRIADCVLRHGSWPLSRSERNRGLSMNRLVTGNLSLVTGDLQKLIPGVTLFSISSYQLPVTSDQSKRFMVPMRGAMAIEASHEPPVISLRDVHQRPGPRE